MGFVDRTPSALSPVFQETIHVDVGQRRADDTALRRAAGAMSPSAHTSLASSSISSTGVSSHVLMRRKHALGYAAVARL
jgi:hypothetical protein